MMIYRPFTEPAAVHLSAPAPIVLLGVAVLGIVGCAPRPHTASSHASAHLQKPRIHSAGGVRKLPGAALQPFADSKTVFDISSYPEAHELNPGLVKVARWINLNATGQIEVGRIQVVAVLHGDATSASLSDAAYEERTGIGPNPNGALLAELKEAGVDVYVCGQALAHRSIPLDDVSSQVTVATAASTALVRLQSQGFSYLPD